MESTDLVQLLGEKYSLEIMRATSYPKSAQEISDDVGIPIATTYRRLKTLTEANLLRQTTLDGEEGSGSTVYHRTVENVRVTFATETLEVAIEYRRDSYPYLRHI